MKHVMITGTSSGVGKTTITIGLMKALKRRGLDIQPFKVGPDYIDTGYHQVVCEKESINLDEFLVPSTKVLKSLYLRRLFQSEIGIIEGAMGFYDGLGSDKFYCSSAGISKILDVPVILVVDGSSSSTSIAAMINGFIDFDNSINFIGVIVNNVSSISHYELISSAINKYCRIPVLGCLNLSNKYRLKSKYLGLVSPDQVEHIDSLLEELAALIEKSVDLDKILELIEVNNLNVSKSREEIVINLKPFYKKKLLDKKVIAVAKDQAFSFYYADNLELLKTVGFEVIEFSPLKDRTLPQADVYYFGGGFPELFIEELSNNVSMKLDIIKAHQEGKAILAECGGLIYLGGSYVSLDKSRFEMVGLLPGTSIMTDRLVRFGYSYFVSDLDNLISPSGFKLRGHEFHYTYFNSNLKRAGVSYSPAKYKKERKWNSGFANNNLFASYSHIHFYQDPKWIKWFLERITRCV